MRSTPPFVAIFVAIVLTISSAGLSAGERFPYRTQVARNQAPVRSGPSEGAYATDALAEKAEVEVFSQEPNGWCAIRPPAGSFSWAPARYLQTTEDEKLAQVTDDGVVAWVGSRVMVVTRPHWQVRLKKGETVEVLGAARLVSAEGGVLETWCKIAPPAGEFRWVHIHDLRPAPLDAAVKQASYEEETTTAKSDAAPSDRKDGSPAKAPAGSIEALEAEVDGFSKQAPTAWRLAALMEQAAEKIEKGATTVERGKARLMLDRLQQISASMPPPAQTEIAPAKTATAPVRGQETLAQPAETRAQPAAPAADPRYDGKGWLMPVLSRRSELPPFALTDNQGQILEYVSPAPGVNLHRYLKQEVGVYGHRGHLPRLGAAHLTVQRVVVLNRHR